ncbi:MAG: glycosyltransferase family 39 protein, partial [Polyangiales bacterium]
MRLFALAAGVILASATVTLLLNPDGHSGAMVDVDQHNGGDLPVWLTVTTLFGLAGASFALAALPTLRVVTAYLAKRIEGLKPEEVRLSLISLTIFAFGMARVLSLLVMDERPITDLEMAASFGGELFANGHASTVAHRLVRDFPITYLHLWHGRLASGAWLVPQLAWAFGHLTHTGPLVFALASGLLVGSVGYAVGGLAGRGYGALAMLFAALSPMQVTLSATSDAHVLSRGAVALVLAFGVAGARHASAKAWFGAALFAGIAMLSRPVESALVLGPLAIYAWTARSTLTVSPRRALVAVAVGAAIPILAFVAHNLAVTGQAHVPPAWAPGFVQAAPTGQFETPFAERVVENAAEATSMLAFWLLGPLGLVLVFLGIGTSRLSKALAIGVGLGIVAGIVAQGRYIRAAGPVPFAECTAPLLVLAGLGVARAVKWFAARHWDARGFGCVAVGAMVATLACFSVWNAAKLRESADAHSRVYAIFERLRIPRSVVLVPPYDALLRSFTDTADLENEVMDWPRPDPNFKNRVLFAKDRPERVEALRAAFPDRRILRLRRVERHSDGMSGVV